MQRWIERRKTKVIKVGKVAIGGNNPIVVQSMTNTFTEDTDSTIAQIKELERVGCEIVRVAVPSVEAVRSLKVIKKSVSVPIIADIHYDYRLAVMAAELADGLRINPGNIGSWDKVKEVIKAAKDAEIPIRIGINSGSLPKDILRDSKSTADALFKTALSYMKRFEDEGFTDIKFSLKGSSVKDTVLANKLFAQSNEYPIHIGITEAGTLLSGAVKSAVGVGILLYEGIGDTLRVSLSAHPKHEVLVAYKILSSLGLRRRGIDVIACPTCGRCKFDLPQLALEVEERLSDVEVPLTVAVMGCAVNGIGEAKEADAGMAGTGDIFVLFAKGKVVGKYPRDEAVKRLEEEVRKLAEKKGLSEKR